MQKRWQVTHNDEVYTLVYQGQKLNREMKTVINGEYREINAVPDSDGAEIAEFIFAGRMATLRHKGRDVTLTIGGQEVPTDIKWQLATLVDMPPELGRKSAPRPEAANSAWGHKSDIDILEEFTPEAQPVQEMPGTNLQEISPVTTTPLDFQGGEIAQLQRKAKSGLGSFLTFVILTFINIILYVFDVQYGFAFSASLPLILMNTGYALDWQLGTDIYAVVGIGLALAIGVLFLVLYLLSRKRTIPVLISVILVIIDTALLVWTAIDLDSAGSMVIDLLFHLWVVVSLIQLYNYKRKLKRAIDKRLEGSLHANDPPF